MTASEIAERFDIRWRGSDGWVDLNYGKGVLLPPYDRSPRSTEATTKYAPPLEGRPYQGTQRRYTPDEKGKMRKLAKIGIPASVIAKQFGMPRCTAVRIIEDAQRQEGMPR